MQIREDQWSAQGLVVTVTPLLTPLKEGVLVDAASDLRGLGYEAFLPMPGGGATFVDQRTQGQIVVQPGSRSISRFIIGSDTTVAMDEIMAALEVLDRHAPVQAYIACQIIYAMSVPVESGYADSLLEKRVLGDEPIASRLGPIHYPGIKIYLDDLGSSYVTVEPLLRDRTRLFVQFGKVSVQAFRIPELRDMLTTAVSFGNAEVRQFVGDFLK